MDLSILISNFIIQLKILINHKNDLMSLYLSISKSKEAGTLKFKLINYNKWLSKLNDIKNSNLDMQINDVKDIKSLKLTSGLEKKIINYYHNNKIDDIEETVSLINNIKTENGISDDKDNMISYNDNVNNVTNKVGKINISEIESIPKQLSEKKRPTDKKGGDIYDLQCVTGIGPSAAKKLVAKDITLELLIEDWNTYVKKDTNNSILMTSKMEPNPKYNQSQWNGIKDEKRHEIQLSYLKQKLTNDSKYLHLLNHHQLLGIKYFYDISQKIPREDIITADKILKNIASRINKDIIITICGSFRRGKDKSGDVDTLITHPDIKTIDDIDRCSHNILSILVKHLTNVNFLVDHLTDFGKTKYMGLCIIPSLNSKKVVARRIDIKFVPYNSYGAAVLYFTGSKNFNTAMRSHALSKGYTLNEYGLYKLVNGKKGDMVSCDTEKDIFKVLNYPYKEPTERNV